MKNALISRKFFRLTIVLPVDKLRRLSQSWITLMKKSNSLCKRNKAVQGDPRSVRGVKLLLERTRHQNSKNVWLVTLLKPKTVMNGAWNASARPYMSKRAARTKTLSVILNASAVSFIFLRFTHIFTSISVGGMYTGLKTYYETLDNSCTAPGCNNSKWTPWTCKDDCKANFLDCVASCPDEDQQCLSACNRELDQCDKKCWLL